MGFGKAFSTYMLSHRELSSSLPLCHRLDFKYLPKAHMLKSWLLTCGTLGWWCNLSEVRSSGKKLDHWGHALKGLGASCPFSPTSFLSGAMRRSGLLCHALLPWCTMLPQTQSHKAGWPLTETFPLYKLFIYLKYFLPWCKAKFASRKCWN